jgi:general transcription factor 3C polypeptide 3 (transcription factor C subunit 4)
MRNGNQEACYNLGRAFHHIQLFPFAICYYEMALDRTIDIDEPDLTRETAYNLATIYVQVGAGLMAQDLLKRFCTIS